jgi:hypothetical protein
VSLAIPPRAPVAGAVAPDPSPAPPARRPWRLAVAGALALALVSLLLPSEPAYDPWAWIIWSREITEGTLSTTTGPSWKPLPVLLTTPFALLGGDVAPAAWLVLGRAGGLLAVVMVYRLAGRMAGTIAGLLAGAFLLVSDEFLLNFARGNSEGLLVALVLFAVERHLDGRPRSTFVLGFAAALLRPEVWPFLGLYGLWLAWRDRRARPLVAAGFAGLVVLWLGPEWWGSGNPLRASDRARQPNLDSAAYAEHPFLEVFRRSSHVLMAPVLAGAALALVVAARGAIDPVQRRLRLAFGAWAAVLMVMVAAMTQAGYAGNLRYVALPAALLCALAGAGWVEAVRAGGARFGPAGRIAAVAAAVAVALPFTIAELRSFADDVRFTGDEAALYEDLDAAITAAGGPAAVRACGPVSTGRFDTMPLAWRLHVPMRDVGIFPSGPGITLSTRNFSLLVPKPSRLSRDPRRPVIGGTAQWLVRARCHGSS